MKYKKNVGPALKAVLKHLPTILEAAEAYQNEQNRLKALSKEKNKKDFSLIVNGPPVEETDMQTGEVDWNPIDAKHSAKINSNGGDA